MDALTPRVLVALLIFIATYGALAFRNVRPSAGVPIWLILLVGAAAMVFTGSITVQEAYTSINLQVIVFLFSMFVLVTALDISGLLERFATSLLLRAKKPQDVIYLTFFGFAFLSSFLMNDTIALMGAPVMMMLAKKMKVSPRPLFFILAFSITIGSTTTPMGNPQNLLVAIGSGMPAPVITFARYLLVPTLLNLIATYFILKLLFGKELEKARPGFDELIVFEAAVMKNNETKQRGFGRLSLAVVLLTLGSIILVNVLETFGVGVPFRISEVSFFGAALLLATSDKSREIVARIDWGILVLFASLFVLTQAVSENGIIAQVAINLPVLNPANPHSSVLAILISSTVLSQVLSNVPMVALYLPLMKSLGFGPQNGYAWASLAGGSTLAGNLTLLGAASNLIVVEQGEKKGFTLGFFEFLKVGILVTVVNVLILYLYLLLVG